MSLSVERLRFDALHRCGGRFDALVVEDALPADLAERAARDILDGKLAMPSERRDDDAARPQVEVHGIAISPSARFPQGPERNAYFAGARLARSRIESLFLPSIDPFARLEAVLRSIHGLAVGTAARRDGQPFGSGTIRRCPEGVGMSVHCENAYLDIPIARDLAESVELERQCSWFYVLRAAEAGGELELTDLSFRERGAVRPDDYPDGCGPFERLVVGARAGDLVLLRSGDLHHRVLPPESGCRITMGGFFAPALGGEGLCYWA